MSLCYQVLCFGFFMLPVLLCRGYLCCRYGFFDSKRFLQQRFVGWASNRFCARIPVTDLDRMSRRRRRRSKFNTGVLVTMEKVGVKIFWRINWVIDQYCQNLSMPMLKITLGKSLDFLPKSIFPAFMMWLLIRKWFSEKLRRLSDLNQSLNADFMFRNMVSTISIPFYLL